MKYGNIHHPTMSNTPVFVSYVQENRPQVLRLVTELRDAGITVWFDQDALQPGTYWRDEIRAAIRNHAFFIACFSQEYLERERTYMNEELTLAIEEIRQRSSAPWFIPVLLSGNIPDREISAGRTLRDIQYIDLSGDRWASGVRALIGTIYQRQMTNGSHSALVPSPSGGGVIQPGPAQPSPNVQLVNVRLLSVDLRFGHAIREVAGPAPHSVPAYVAVFRNDPTGEPIGQAKAVGAKITFHATDFTVSAIGLWTDGEERTTFAVGTTKTLWLAVIPNNDVPRTVELTWRENARIPGLQHQMLRRINYRTEVLLFDATGARIAQVEIPLDLTI